MGILDMLKSAFSGAEEVVPNVENNTSHPDPKFKNLDGRSFKAEYQASKGGVMLDVRTGMEYRSGALPKAQNVDFMSSAFAREVAGLDKSKTYFLYCRSGNRSGQACSVMHRMGFDVRNLNGGIGAWPR